jgi:hypothetical protein
MDKAHKGNLILLFFLSPLFGLMKIFKLRNEKDITFFGALFFGLAGSTYVYRDGSDGYTHLMNAKENYTDMSVLNFFEKAYQILTFSSTDGITDIYLHILSFVSMSLFRTPELIHLFAGFVLGYFFTKSVLLLLKDNLKVKNSFILIGFIALFLLIRSLGALNSVRMWTGMWVLFCGTYGWAITKEKKYIFITIFAIFVHFSYAVILVPVIAAYIMQKRKKLLVVLYAVSFFATVSFSVVEAYIPKLDLLQSKQKSYAINSEEDAERYEDNRLLAQGEIENMNFYKGFGEVYYLKYSIVGLSLILLFFYLKKNLDLNLQFLIAIGIGIYTFSNLVAFSPSLQGRTKTIAATFILAAAIHLQLTFKNHNLKLSTLKNVNKGLKLFLISSLPMVMFQLSYIFQTFSFFILFLPPVSWLVGDSDYSIRKVIGLLID